ASDQGRRQAHGHPRKVQSLLWPIHLRQAQKKGKATGSSAPGRRRRRASPSASPPRAVAPSPVPPIHCPQPAASHSTALACPPGGRRSLLPRFSLPTRRLTSHDSRPWPSAAPSRLAAVNSEADSRPSGGQATGTAHQCNAMKVKILQWHAVASWTWDAQDETCGICRMAFDGCCPDCKFPGDDCPLIWGACNHAYHLHCILKWVNSQTSTPLCPMCRREWQFKG
ncbi:hypothetical protein U9M48_007157, partial [Paspalum notatum var. saurae]